MAKPLFSDNNVIEPFEDQIPAYFTNRDSKPTGLRNCADVYSKKNVVCSNRHTYVGDYTSGVQQCSLDPTQTSDDMPACVTPPGLPDGVCPDEMPYKIRSGGLLYNRTRSDVPYGTLCSSRDKDDSSILDHSRTPTNYNILSDRLSADGDKFKFTGKQGECVRNFNKKINPYAGEQGIKEYDTNDGAMCVDQMLIKPLGPPALDFRIILVDYSSYNIEDTVSGLLEFWEPAQARLIKQNKWNASNRHYYIQFISEFGEKDIGDWYDTIFWLNELDNYDGIDFRRIHATKTNSLTIQAEPDRKGRNGQKHLVSQLNKIGFFQNFKGEVFHLSLFEHGGTGPGFQLQNGSYVPKKCEERSQDKCLSTVGCIKNTYTCETSTDHFDYSKFDTRGGNRKYNVITQDYFDKHPELAKQGVRPGSSYYEVSHTNYTNTTDPAEQMKEDTPASCLASGAVLSGNKCIDPRLECIQTGTMYMPVTKPALTRSQMHELDHFFPYDAKCPGAIDTFGNLSGEDKKKDGKRLGLMSGGDVRSAPTSNKKDPSKNPTDAGSYLAPMYIVRSNDYCNPSKKGIGFASKSAEGNTFGVLTGPFPQPNQKVAGDFNEDMALDASLGLTKYTEYVDKQIEFPEMDRFGNANWIVPVHNYIWCCDTSVLDGGNIDHAPSGITQKGIATRSVDDPSIGEANPYNIESRALPQKFSRTPLQWKCFKKTPEKHFTQEVKFDSSTKSVRNMLEGTPPTETNYQAPDPNIKQIYRIVPYPHAPGGPGIIMIVDYDENNGLEPGDRGFNRDLAHMRCLMQGACDGSWVEKLDLPGVNTTKTSDGICYNIVDVYAGHSDYIFVYQLSSLTLYAETSHSIKSPGLHVFKTSVTEGSTTQEVEDALLIKNKKKRRAQLEKIKTFDEGVLAGLNKSINSANTNPEAVGKGMDIGLTIAAAISWLLLIALLWALFTMKMAEATAEQFEANTFYAICAAPFQQWACTVGSVLLAISVTLETVAAVEAWKATTRQHIFDDPSSSDAPGAGEKSELNKEIKQIDSLEKGRGRKGRGARDDKLINPMSDKEFEMIKEHMNNNGLLVTNKVKNPSNNYFDPSVKIISGAGDDYIYIRHLNYLSSHEPQSSLSMEEKKDGKKTLSLANTPATSIYRYHIPKLLAYTKPIDWSLHGNKDELVDQGIAAPCYSPCQTWWDMPFAKNGLASQDRSTNPTWQSAPMFQNFEVTPDYIYAWGMCFPQYNWFRDHEGREQNRLYPYNADYELDGGWMKPIYNLFRCKRPEKQKANTGDVFVWELYEPCSVGKNKSRVMNFAFDTQAVKQNIDVMTSSQFIMRESLFYNLEETPIDGDISSLQKTAITKVMTSESTMSIGNLDQNLYQDPNDPALLPNCINFNLPNICFLFYPKMEKITYAYDVCFPTSDNYSLWLKIDGKRMWVSPEDWSITNGLYISSKSWKNGDFNDDHNRKFTITVYNSQIQKWVGSKDPIRMSFSYSTPDNAVWNSIYTPYSNLLYIVQYPIPLIIPDNQVTERFPNGEEYSISNYYSASPIQSNFESNVIKIIDIKCFMSIPPVSGQGSIKCSQWEYPMTHIENGSISKQVLKDIYCISRDADVRPSDWLTMVKNVSEQAMKLKRHDIIDSLNFDNNTKILISTYREMNDHDSIMKSILNSLDLNKAELDKLDMKIMNQQRQRDMDNEASVKSDEKLFLLKVLTAYLLLISIPFILKYMFPRGAINKYFMMIIAIITIPIWVGVSIYLYSIRNQSNQRWGLKDFKNAKNIPTIDTRKDGKDDDSECEDETHRGRGTKFSFSLDDNSQFEKDVKELSDKNLENKYCIKHPKDGLTPKTQHEIKALENKIKLYTAKQKVDHKESKALQTEIHKAEKIIQKLKKIKSKK